jgi:hypothetical protein
MSTERDIERVLDAWLAPGPTEMPDRLYVEVLERLERTPQRGVAWSPRRFTSMFAPLKLAAAAVVAALLIGIVTVPLWLPSTDVLQAPAASASPSTSATPGTAVTPIDKPLSGRWTRPPSTVDGLSLDPAAAFWGIDRWGLWVDVPDGGTDLGSDATAIGPDRFQLVSKFDHGGCPAGTVGTYSWSVSEGDTRLAVEPVADACPPRAEFLTGEWRRAGYCDVEWQDCTGNLPSGRFEAAMFDPRLPADQPLRSRIGALTFEVPDGWANDWEALDLYRLTTTKGYASEAAGAATGPDYIWVFARPVAVQSALASDCKRTRDLSVDATVDGLTAWLTAHPGVTVIGAPSTLTIDGHPATVVDIDIDAAVPASACFDGDPGVPLFADAMAFDKTGKWVNDFWDAWVGTADPLRVILIDLDGQPLLIILDSTDPANQASWVEEAMPIVESFEFPT